MTGDSWASDNSAGYISEIEGNENPPPSYQRYAAHEFHEAPLVNSSSGYGGGNSEDPGLRFYKPRRENRCLLILVMFVAFAFMILFSVFFGLYIRDEYEKAYQPRPQNATVLTTFSTTMFIEVPITVFKTQSTTFMQITALQTTVPTTTTKTTTITETLEFVTIRPSSVSACWSLLWSICSGHVEAGDQEDGWCNCEHIYRHFYCDMINNLDEGGLVIPTDSSPLCGGMKGWCESGGTSSSHGRTALPSWTSLTSLSAAMASQT
jgi:hypothetical protein